MFEYFKPLAKDVSSIVNETVVKILSQNIRGDKRRTIYDKFFRNATILEMVKNASNGSFLQRFDSFKKTNNILSYSFVRHPFDR